MINQNMPNLIQHAFVIFIFALIGANTAHCADPKKAPILTLTLQQHSHETQMLEQFSISWQSENAAPEITLNTNRFNQSQRYLGYFIAKNAASFKKLEQLITGMSKHRLSQKAIDSTALKRFNLTTKNAPTSPDHSKEGWVNGIQITQKKQIAIALEEIETLFSKKETFTQHLNAIDAIEVHPVGAGGHTEIRTLAKTAPRFKKNKLICPSHAPCLIPHYGVILP